MSATQLLLRLSDERSWASAPFSASSADDLREGALEAFACLRAEWRRIVDADIPAYQTINRSHRYAERARVLHVQVCYHGEWVAQHWTPTITEPGCAPGAPTAWADENWGDAWNRCVRTFDHVNQIGKLANWASK